MGKELLIQVTPCVGSAMDGYTSLAVPARDFCTGQIKDLTCKNFDSFVGAIRHKLAQGDRMGCVRHEFLRKAGRCRPL